MSDLNSLIQKWTDTASEVDQCKMLLDKAHANHRSAQAKYHGLENEIIKRLTDLYGKGMICIDLDERYAVVAHIGIDGSSLALTLKHQAKD